MNLDLIIVISKIFLTFFRLSDFGYFPTNVG